MDLLSSCYHRDWQAPFLFLNIIYEYVFKKGSDCNISFSFPYIGKIILWYRCIFSCTLGILPIYLRTGTSNLKYRKRHPVGCLSVFLFCYFRGFRRRGIGLCCFGSSGRSLIVLFCCIYFDGASCSSYSLTSFSAFCFCAMFASSSLVSM